ncbi:MULTISPECIES: glycosyltransferase family A protein [unclassified Exiguobacterium]|uniref:glycosyltransferase family A protein n=1 Tax=unclassified Exiguobacterium TaxID=2644629 RepID=UPI001BECE03E|nr:MULTISPECIES: glycosyltransferase family A protein [unclassified Exiguobacterium]
MNISVLVSTMNSNYDLHKKLNITKGVIINQTNKNEERLIFDSFKYINVNETGLSNSRNLAIKNSNSDVSILADDDMIYVDNYEHIIEEAYNEYPNADIIVFNVERIGGRKKMYKKSPRKLNIFSIMKVSSVEITFKTAEIKKKNIFFDKDFGAGARFLMGEENIFLKECLRRKMEIQYVPVNIARVNMENSSWFTGYNNEYLKAKGAVFKALFPTLWPVISFQFLIRKSFELKINRKNFLSKYGTMINGAKEYKMR